MNDSKTDSRKVDYKLYEYLTHQRAVQYLCTTTWTLSGIVERGLLLAYYLPDNQIPRYRRADLDALILSHPPLSQSHGVIFDNVKLAAYWANRGWALYFRPVKRANDMQNALKHLRDAICLDDEEPTYHYFLGCILNDLEKTQEAVKQFKEVLRLDPKFKQAARQLKLISMPMEEREERIKEINKAEQTLLCEIFRNWLRSVFNY